MKFVIQRIGKTFTFSVNGNHVTDSQVPSGTSINYLGLIPYADSTTFTIYNWTVNTCDQGTPAPTYSTLILCAFVDDCFVRIYIHAALQAVL